MIKNKKKLLKYEKRRLKNISNRSMLRTLIKKILNNIQLKNKLKVIKDFKIMQANMDRQACKGLIHKNKISRYKSKIYKKFKNI